jgi:N,N'-diacetyllegionaminate synthase
VEQVKIAQHIIGDGQPCFIIAEAGVNHNGMIEQAQRLVDIAAQVGADAVKFQTFKAERLASENAPKAGYQLTTTDSGESQLDMLRRLELSSADHQKLLAYCQERKILFLSTPFDELSADLLDELDVAAFKIGSGEITNLPFLNHVARKSKPMIVSTGMASLEEVEAAVETICSVGNDQLVLLHCVSNYPADPADANLRAMDTLRRAFNVPVGFSDHTLGIEVPLAAVALGARVIEKHFTLDRCLPGPDQQASLEPHELQAMVAGIRKVEMALGDGKKIPAASEANTSEVARKSLVAAQDIPAGTVLTEAMIAIKRPGSGLPPTMRPSIIGRTAGKDIAAGSLLKLEELH